MPAYSYEGLPTSGTTAQRPTNAQAGFHYFDTDLNRTVVFNGTAYQDVGGATDTPGAKNGSAVSVAEAGSVVHKTVLTLADLSVTMTDAGAAGCHGSHKLYDFPEGNILILGGSCNLTTLAGAGGIADGAALVGAVGTAAVGTNNATLTTTEADIIPSIAGTLTSGAGALAGESTTALIAAFDGTATAKDAYLNLAVPDADSSASDTVAVSGTITIVWVNLGDN